MSATNQPPSYDDHANYHAQPPQNYQQPATVVMTHQNPGQFQPAPHVTVISQQPQPNVVVGVIPIMGPLPVAMTCPNCYAYVTTSISHEISLRTHCCALGFCLIGLWPCAIIPYLCGGCCKKTIHTCPNCRSFLGSD